MTRSDHFDGRRFFNPGDSADRSIGDLLRWITSGQRQRWPRWVENQVTCRLPQAVPPGTVALTWVNHATFLIQTMDLNVLTDPVWAWRASPVQFMGPRRVRFPGVPFGRLPRIHVALLSHNHYDHLDLATLRRLQRVFGTHVVTALGNGEYLRRRGLRHATELDWWQSHHADGMTVTATPAQHFSARTPFDRDRTLWAGFVVRLRGLRVYFAGDSGYWRHFTEIGERLGPPSLSLIPIGAYEPRWFMKPAHMNPDEAVRAHLDLRSALSVAMHFGCFQLTDEGIDEPVRELERARAAHGVRAEAFRVMEPGETILVEGGVAE